MPFSQVVRGATVIFCSCKMKFWSLLPLSTCRVLQEAPSLELYDEDLPENPGLFEGDIELSKHQAG